VDNLTIVTNLVEVNSGDYQRAMSELEELKKKLPEAEKPKEIVEPEP